MCNTLALAVGCVLLFGFRDTIDENYTRCQEGTFSPEEGFGWGQQNCDDVRQSYGLIHNVRLPARHPPLRPTGRHCAPVTLTL